jgi:hypothetical protein
VTQAAKVTMAERVKSFIGKGYCFWYITEIVGKYGNQDRLAFRIYMPRVLQKNVKSDRKKWNINLLTNTNK